MLHRKQIPALDGEDEEDWPLSPHLQYPAPSRAQKMHNVGLVLTALGKGGGNAHGVEAKDIVDGYREKTVGLLWGLLCQYGLGMLLDWDEVQQETRRFKKTLFMHVEDDDMDGLDHVATLKNWATVIAALRRATTRAH